MNLNNFTIKASEALQQAQQLAFNAQNLQLKRNILCRRCWNRKILLLNIC